MGDGSKIEWTDASWNPVRARRRLADGAVMRGWHCEHVSEGCRNCYAEGFNRRLGTKLEYKPGHLKAAHRPQGEVELFLDETMLLQPLRWRAPRKVFVGSMTDVFADFVTDEWLDRMFAVMALCPQHVFQVLTKRPARMRRWFDRYDAAHDHNAADMIADAAAVLLGRPDARGGDRYDGAGPSWPLPNVWLGTSIEDRAALLERAGHLRLTPAAVRFFSCEPLLGDLGQVVLNGIDWIICGGESGPNARPMHPDWARSLRDQCAAAGVPFFFKQWGGWAPNENFDYDVAPPPAPCRSRQIGECFGQSNDPIVWLVGKKAAGRLLDGVEHSGMPGVPA